MPPSFHVAVRFPVTITIRCTRCGAEATGDFGSGLADATDADTVFDAPSEVEVDGCPACEPEGGPGGQELSEVGAAE